MVYINFRGVRGVVLQPSSTDVCIRKNNWPCRRENVIECGVTYCVVSMQIDEPLKAVEQHELGGITVRSRLGSCVF